MHKIRYYLLLAAVAALVGGFAVTNQSLWIDEGAAAIKALEPSLGAWWQNLRSEGNSNLQLIGELLYLWGWVKIFGGSEIALRASNIPFFVGGVVALTWGISRRRTLQNALAAIALTNAFLWYYVSEARPYIVLFGFAALTTGCLLRLLQETNETWQSAAWYGWFCLGIVGLCATSLIAVPWALGALAAALFWVGWRAALNLALRCTISSALTAAALSGLGIYYLWTLQLGARASDVGRTGLTNVVFIFYELLGLGGLGPGRLDLREEGPQALLAFSPALALGALAALLLLAIGFWTRRARLTTRHCVFFALGVAAPFALVLAAGVAAHMRLVGRHLTPLLPWLLAWMSVGLAALFAGGLWKRGVATALVAVWLLSAVEIRFAPRHRRDDYRGAAAIARAEVAAGGRVWWLADFNTGQYYHVPLNSSQVATSPNDTPTLVILSKPDIYDPAGKARAYLATDGSKVDRVLPAFRIWRRPPGR